MFIYPKTIIPSNKDLNVLMIILSWTLFPISIENSFTLPIISISFLPLFYLAKHIESSKKYFLIIFTTSIIFSFRWYFWINDTGYHLKFGLLILANTFLYCIPFIVLRYKNEIGFILCWLAIEIFHLHAPIGSPIPVIGNYLSFSSHIIQWYEYTGILGGSLYVFIINWIIWYLINNKKILIKKKVTIALIAVSMPLVFSVIITPDVEKGEVEIFSLGTNLNARTQKYKLSERVVLKQYIDSTKKYITPNTELIIWPETALFEHRNLNEEGLSHRLTKISSQLNLQPSASIITGVVLNEFFKITKNDDVTTDMIQSMYKDQYYRSYNAIIKIPSDSIHFKVKQNLVPFNEYQPATWLGKILFNIDKKNIFKFSKFRYGRSIFKLENNIKLLPLICFESAFGHQVIQNSHKANLISVSLNEGWYDSIRGSKIFNSIAKCRAIENRKYTVTSSNCGYASIINISGKVKLNYRGTSSLGHINLSDRRTIYSHYGDYPMFLVISIIFLLNIIFYEKF